MKKRRTVKEENSMSKRRLQEGQGFYIAATILLAMGIVFAVVCDVFHLEFPLSSPCFLDEQLHLYCPGCGGTRALFAMMRLDLVESVLCNPIVLYMAALFLYYYIGTSMAVLAKGRRVYFRPGFWMIWVGVILLFWTTILRNYLAVRYGIDYLGDIAPYWS